MDFFFPKIAYASVDSFIANVNKLIVNPLIKVMFAVAFVVFAYGVFQFLANQESEDKRTAGKRHMLWGVIGMTIMIGVFFFMNLLIDSFDLESGGTINPETGEVDLNEYNPNWP